MPDCIPFWAIYGALNAKFPTLTFKKFPNATLPPVLIRFQPNFMMVVLTEHSLLLVYYLFWAIC